MPERIKSLSSYWRALAILLLGTMASTLHAAGSADLSISTLAAGAYNGTNLADLNGDGILDLVTTGASSLATAPGSLTVQYGDGHGSFTSAIALTVPGSFTSTTVTNANNGNYTGIDLSATAPSAVATADLNGDGKAEIVVVQNKLAGTSASSGTPGTVPYPIYTVWQAVAQTYTACAFPPIAPSTAQDTSLTVTGLQLADLNGDGLPDLIATYSEASSGTGIMPYNQGLAVLLNSSTAPCGFSTTPILIPTYRGLTASANPTLPQTVRIADINGDNHPDLFVLYPQTLTLTTLPVYLGNGDGTFQDPIGFSTSASFYGVPVLADLNGDTKLDLALIAETSAGQAEIAIAMGNGDGTFLAPSFLALTGGDSIRTAGLAAADLDNDGHPDLALFEASAPSGLFFGNGDGTFTSSPGDTGDVQPAQLLSTTTGGPATAIDLNGDTHPDLISGTAILLNTTTAPPPTLTSTTPTLSASPSTATAGAPITLTIAVAPTSGTGMPSGSVALYDGTNLFHTVTLLHGAATYSTTALNNTSHSLTAVYSGDTTFSTSTSLAATVAISAAPPRNTSTTLSAAPTATTSGTTVALVAAVAQVSGPAAPAGSVTFSDNFNAASTSLGTATIDPSSGKAIFGIATLAVGTHSVTASYPGNSGFAASASAPALVTIVAPAQTATTTVISSATGTINFTVGSTAAFTITVSSATGSAAPTGFITCTDGGAPFAHILLQTANNTGVASCSTSTLTPGTHSIDAVYSGDTNFSASTGASLSINMVNGTPTLIPTNLGITASPTTAATGAPITLTATLSFTGGPAPTGTVTFTDSGSPIGTVTVANARAIFTTTSLAAGTHTIAAIYSGESAFSGSTTTNPVTVTITSSSPGTPDFAIAVSPSAGTVTHGNSLSATLSITSAGGFSQPVSLACTGAPANSACTLSAASVTPSTTAPGTASVTFQASAQTSKLRSPHLFSPAAEVALATLLPLGLLTLRKRRLPSLLTLAVAALLTSTLFAASGCGGKSTTEFNGPGTTAPGTYTLTLTATSGPTTHTALWTVSVQ